MQKNELIVFDFDETLIRANTFTLWCKWLLKSSLTRLNFLLFSKLVICFIKRKVIKTFTHEIFKLKLISIVPNNYNELFADYLCKEVQWNEVLVAECKLKIDKCYVIVSSAAPEGYLNAALNKKGVFPYKTIGCKVVGGALLDNYKSYKAENLEIELEAFNKNKIDVLYTDSLDDAASMNLSTDVNFIIYNDADKNNINIDLFDAKITFINVGRLKK